MKRLLALFALCLPVCLFAQGFGSFSHDQPYFARDAGSGCAFPWDDIESYTQYAEVSGLNGGCLFDAAYVDRPNQFGIYALDSFETYVDGANANNLDGNPFGWNVPSPYVDKLNPLGIYSYDTMESYADGAIVNGLNGGTDNGYGNIFGGAYVDR